MRIPKSTGATIRQELLVTIPDLLVLLFKKKPRVVFFPRVWSGGFVISDSTLAEQQTKKGGFPETWAQASGETVDGSEIPNNHLWTEILIMGII